jgi:hypothetical protein
MVQGSQNRLKTNILVPGKLPIYICKSFITDILLDG